ncbi:MAG TPA: 30S ribosomal protein S9 [bacterium]|mgnify:CR=1 FL=1|nr:30S ribosomal protein S9 [bacterium]
MTAKTDTPKQYIRALGRRKTAVASVHLTENSQAMLMNGEKIEFSEAVLAPLILVGKKDAFGVSAKVKGGGKASQLDAIRLGIARALEKYDGEYRTTLKKAGMLTRDPREAERKKPGLKGARRSPQWAKR